MESSNPGMVGVGKELKAHPGPILDLGTARAEDWEQFQGFWGWFGSNSEMLQNGSSGRCQAGKKQHLGLKLRF